jgi:drug/metabolite transporter (DMT)-like permease
MTWQLIIIIQIFMSSLMTLFARHIAVSTRRVFFGIGIFSYLAIAIAGTSFALLHSHSLPPLPSGQALVYILIEGMCIPTAWLFQYKLIGYIGASNTVIVSSINTVGAALMGIIFLGESLSIAFISGALFVLGSVYIALQIQPDMTHHKTASLETKILIAFGSFVFFSIGMFFEKKAIDAITVWNYACFGWGMQFIGALLVFLVFGRAEIAHITGTVVRKGLLLGFITSLSGVLFILALSKGSLSHTIVATSGKVAVTMLLSAIILKERNQLGLRLTAFVLSSIGIGLIII